MGLIIGLIILGVALIGIGAAVYFLYIAPQKQGGFYAGSSNNPLQGFGNRNPLNQAARMGGNSPLSAVEADEQQIQDNITKVRAAQKKTRKKPAPVSIQQKFFMAGMFTDDDRKDFQRLRVLVPIGVAPLLGVVMWLYMGLDWFFIGIIFGGLLGLQIPFTILDRRIKQRNEEILYFLPLVIEQIAIGVSSSLDIGPCIQRVVLMADERDSHNVVTELIKIVNNYVRSGASLDDAFGEVGQLSGNTELKHTFASLAQVARHGGEVTRQLQELADAVSAQRETQIEGRIKKLELVATGPVALVFMGFLIILLIGFGLQVMGAFG
jgi:Flp pilus assembly protein TadB